MPENGGMSGILGKETAGLPNWAWLLIVAAGIGAAYILPKFFGGQSKQASDQTSTDQGTSNSGTSGLGLAIDPTTGLPYAVEGLVPSGGTSGGVPSPVSPPTPTPTPAPTPTPQPKPKPKKHPRITKEGQQDITEGQGDIVPPPPPHPLGIHPLGIHPPHATTVRKWPQSASTLGDVARMHGITERRLQLLNPHITNPNHLQPGQKIRVA